MRKAIAEGEDQYEALLELRSTPRHGGLPSPAQHDPDPHTPTGAEREEGTLKKSLNRRNRRTSTSGCGIESDVRVLPIHGCATYVRTVWCRPVGSWPYTSCTNELRKKY
ncbi:hypothetical protein RRG08_056748 [Elysia crispata]|uniref:Uncharacterized protein n=1 Tax=Elysia crispata TaxID=231223 RepID=A0AAE0ZS23_9GAST|nr:hypothetical protein RRG08_056748 [Elysia crispata]